MFTASYPKALRSPIISKTKKHKLKITNRVAKVLGMRGVLLTRAGSLLISPLFVRQK